MSEQIKNEKLYNNNNNKNKPTTFLIKHHKRRKRMDCRNFSERVNWMGDRFIYLFEDLLMKICNFEQLNWIEHKKTNVPLLMWFYFGWGYGITDSRISSYQKHRKNFIHSVNIESMVVNIVQYSTSRGHPIIYKSNVSS